MPAETFVEHTTDWSSKNWGEVATTATLAKAKVPVVISMGSFSTFENVVNHYQY